MNYPQSINIWQLIKTNKHKNKPYIPISQPNTLNFLSHYSTNIQRRKSPFELYIDRKKSPVSTKWSAFKAKIKCYSSSPHNPPDIFKKNISWQTQQFTPIATIRIGSFSSYGSRSPPNQRHKSSQSKRIIKSNAKLNQINNCLTIQNPFRPWSSKKNQLPNAEQFFNL